MAKFYFTYGTDGQPFFGGWTEVEAPDAHAACAAFRAYHPDKTEGLVNCSSIYDEEKFKLTEMYLSISSHILPKSLGSNVKVKSFFSIAILFLPVAPIGQPVMQ